MENNHPLQVVCDINDGYYKLPKQFIDMAHPWDNDPTRVRKVCDIFGPHWYQEYSEENPLVLEKSDLWTSDRLNPLPNTTSEWMAEKPIILGETARYWNTEFGWDVFFENYPNCETYVCNYDWYTDYLNMGLKRHIQSMIFWGGEGSPAMSHLVNGETLGDESWAYGWGRPYNIGHGGEAVRDFSPY